MARQGGLGLATAAFVVLWGGSALTAAVVGLTSWAVMLAEIAAAFVLGLAGLRELRRQGGRARG